MRDQTGARRALALAAVLCSLALAAYACGGSSHDGVVASSDATRLNADAMIAEGRDTFRFDTFGSEAFFGDTIRLHEAIEGTAHGGTVTAVGNGLSPRTALAVGLKVDVDRVPADMAAALGAGTLDLDNPDNTLVLLKNDAVVGVKGFFDAGPDTLRLTKVGIQCALCHSTVDDSFAVGIGRRRDGWPNRDLNVGAIIAIAPNLQPVASLLSSGGTTVTVGAVVAVLQSWGPGKFDAELFLDGKTQNPAPTPPGTSPPSSSATLIPPAFGLAGVNLGTWTGWGSVTHWNAVVANLEMHGTPGTFFDPRLRDAAKFPIAAANGFDDVRPPPGTADRITPKLAALHFYQLAIPAPVTTTADAAAAARGEALFEGKAKCATCHVPPLYTEPGWNMHAGAEIGIDDFQAMRSPDERYRTAPLKGLFAHEKGGFFHDGRFATLGDVVDHYDGAAVFDIDLTASEKADLVAFLKSL